MGSAAGIPTASIASGADPSNLLPGYPALGALLYPPQLCPKNENGSMAMLCPGRVFEPFNTLRNKTLRATNTGQKLTDSEMQSKFNVLIMTQSMHPVFASLLEFEATRLLASMCTRETAKQFLNRHLGSMAGGQDHNCYVALTMSIGVLDPDVVATNSGPPARVSQDGEMPGICERLLAEIGSGADAEDGRKYTQTNLSALLKASGSDLPQLQSDALGHKARMSDLMQTNPTIDPVSWYGECVEGTSNKFYEGLMVQDSGDADVPPTYTLANHHGPLPADGAVVSLQDGIVEILMSGATKQRAIAQAQKIKTKKIGSGKTYTLVTRPALLSINVASSNRNKQPGLLGSDRPAKRCKSQAGPVPMADGGIATDDGAAAAGSGGGGGGGHALIVSVLTEIATIYTDGCDEGRAKAFRNAAKTMQSYDGAMDEKSLVAAGGIGSNIAAVILEVSATGKSSRLNTLK
jgi:hypothetical protein